MSLQQWLINGWLKAHTPSRTEIRDLLGVADRDLENSSVPGLSPDWQLNIAYNAALQLATAALSAAGFRAEREAHHFRVIQSLAHTIGASAEEVALLDGFRKKRNISDYERAHVVSDREAVEMQKAARDLRRRVEDWLRAEHPELL